MGLTVLRVSGGFRIMDVEEYRNESEDIDCHWEWVEESEVLYAEEVEAELALQGMKK